MCALTMLSAVARKLSLLHFWVLCLHVLPLLQGCYTSVEHQFNATYFSATKEDPQMYLMAR